MIERYRVCYYPMAVDDLRNIFLYIKDELQNPSAAEKIINAIRQGVKSLNQMPERHKIVDWEPWRGKRIHQFPIKSYVVFYEVCDKNKCVNIVRIVYGGVDLSKLDQ